VHVDSPIVIRSDVFFTVQAQGTPRIVDLFLRIQKDLSGYTWFSRWNSFGLTEGNGIAIGPTLDQHTPPKFAMVSMDMVRLCLEVLGDLRARYSDPHRTLLHRGVLHEARPFRVSLVPVPEC